MKLGKYLDLAPEYIFSRIEKSRIIVEKETNRKVLNLSIGSPDIRPCKSYLDKYLEFIQEKDSHLYPGYGAIPIFREAMTNWYKKRFNVSLNDNEILPLLGAKDGVTHLPFTLLQDGEEVLVPDPGYPAFKTSVVLSGGVCVPYNIDAMHGLNNEEIKSKVTKRTKFIWLNFPSNPTGCVMNIEELQKVVDFAKRENIIIIYDNAYSEITFDGFVAPSIFQVDGAKDVAVEIGSFSKTFSFAGFRMGWAVGNKDIIAGLSKIKSQFDSGMSIPLQKLGAFALSNFDIKWYRSMIFEYCQRREIIAGYLKKLDLEFFLPKGSLYIWAKIPDAFQNSEEFCMKLLNENQVLLAPGSAFGRNGDRYVRASICSDIPRYP